MTLLGLYGNIDHIVVGSTGIFAIETKILEVLTLLMETSGCMAVVLIQKKLMVIRENKLKLILVQC